jgi:hypothetical protein
VTAPISRREAIQEAIQLTLLGGALAACARETPDAAPGGMDDDAYALLTDVADTLLPTTAASPGARAAGAGPAMRLLLTDCYAPDAQRRVARGLAALRRACRDRTGREFAALPTPERERFLRAVDAEARRAGETHDFHLVRELAERAYFSSEIGMTRALRYVRVPGRWEGCVPLAPGQPAWA